MPDATFRISGQKFRVIPEDEYKAMRAAMQTIERQSREDAADLAEAQKRLRDRKRKSVPLKRLKADLGF